MYSDDVWAWFLPFSSTDYTRHFLKAIYEKNGVQEPLSNSYKNADPFCFYIEHGKKFYRQTMCAPYELKPILLFYGVTQLLKACLLTVDPDYPKNASVLAHGVSARKRKKSRYEFLQDTVQIQKSGLFSYASQHLFAASPMDGIKLKMVDLMQSIPDLHPLYERLLNRSYCYPVFAHDDGTYSVTDDILNELHMAKDRFFHFLSQYIEPVRQPVQKRLVFRVINPAVFLRDINGKWYLSCIKSNYPPISEPLVHYLLLYNLSMIARYETEWWTILHMEHTSIDLPLIHFFLDVTEKKFPMLIAEWLHDKMSSI